MRLVATVFLFANVLAAQGPADASLHVAFVGEPKTERGQSFVRFLRAHYPRVDAIERTTAAPGQLRGADVVVLDWPQDQGVMAWMKDREKSRHNPLGPLTRWDRPTVLIGSAGLNVAADWGLPGTHG